MAPKDWKTIESDIIADHHVNKLQPVRVIVLGAGISGIAFAYKVKEYENVSFIIYDKNPDVGGTWYESKYPGVACDVPVHCYTYTWVGNPNWSRMYAPATEIHDFYKGLAKGYGVYEHTKLNHAIKRAEWDDKANVWAITVENLTTGEVFVDHAEVFLNLGGNLKYWPEIEGLHDFKGSLVHPAVWDDNLDVKGKRIGVIGSGASAIQLVPTLKPIAKSIVSFHRSPQWIAGEFVGDMAAQGRATMYSEEQKERFRNDPEYFKQFRREIEHGMNVRFPVFYKSSATQAKVREIVTKSMRARLRDDPVLCEKLIPKFPVGCRRVTPGHGYLEALLSDKVEVETTHISKVTETGILMQDGRFHELDIILTATGYDTSYVPRFPLIGLNEVNLNERWQKEGPRAYLGLTAPSVPNYFITLGPNSPVSNGSLVYAMETVLDYALKFIKKLQTQDLAYFVASERATDEFIEWKDTFMQQMSWTGTCTSWYKNKGSANGSVIGPWPGSCHHFVEIARDPRYEDFDYKYKSRNRFRYFGDGRSTWEENDVPLGSHIP